MQIGPYTVLGELGRGGMGVVFRCRAPAGQEVALKLLRSASPQARARFERERRLLIEVGSTPGFVPILDSGDAREGPFLVMPILGGGTLRDRLKRGPLSIVDTLAVAERLGRALARAHELGIIHRDVKPENVLYDNAGVPSLADLGIAKHFASDGLATSQGAALSRSGALCGTAGYMAPEQAVEARSVGPAADVFALGAVLYECLAGWAAFEGRTMLEVLSKMQSESPPPIANARPETPVWLGQIVERSLARSLDGRFADAGAVVRALEARRVEGPPPAPRRDRLVLVLGVVMAVGLVATALVATRSKRTPNPAVAATPTASPGGTSASGPDRAGPISVEATLAAVRMATPASRHRLLEPLLRRGAVLPLDDARALAKLEPPAPEAAALLGLALLLNGAPTDRSEAARLLAQGRAIPEIKALADLTASVDVIAVRFDRILAASRVRDPSATAAPSELVARFDAVNVSLARLISWRSDPVNAALAPLEPRFRQLVIAGDIVHVAVGWAPLAPVLAQFPAGSDAGWRPSPVLSTALALFALQTDPTPASMMADAQQVVALARRCSSVDPALAATALLRAYSDFTNDLDLYTRVASACELDAALVALVAAIPSPAEHFTFELALLRQRRAFCWRLCVFDVRGRDDRRLAQGRAAAERAYLMSRDLDVAGADSDAEDLIRYCIESQETSRVDESLIAACRDRVRRLKTGTLAELARIRGQPGLALADLREDDSGWTHDEYAIAVLCELDLGDLAKAREYWSTLDERTVHGTKQYPGLSYLRSEQIAERIDAASKK